MVGSVLTDGLLFPSCSHLFLDDLPLSLQVLNLAQSLLLFSLLEHSLDERVRDVGIDAVLGIHVSDGLSHVVTGDGVRDVRRARDL